MLEVQVDRSRIRVGVVGTQLLDEFTITWRSAISGNDVIEGITLLTVTCQTNFNSYFAIKFCKVNKKRSAFRLISGAKIRCENRKCNTLNRKIVEK